MKPIKIPRKLKKALKIAYLGGAISVWKTSEVRICGIGSKRKWNPLGVVGNVRVTSATLG
jgi:hypothetical protein